MIVPNQSNIKVHFAGLENIDFAKILHEVSQIKYSLFTVFPYIAGCLNIKPLKMKTCTIESPRYLCSKSCHTIMDSGLFTLMFGAHAGKRDAKQIDIWYNALVEFVLNNKLTSTCVEVDCQKILGVESAWKYRNKMRDDLKNNRQINVFHIDDGNKGLDQLIEFSDYIAISVPKLRAIKKKNYTEKIANYIKNKKPNINIHLLGCTENTILKNLYFCTSADSTSWISVNKYGFLKYNNGSKTYNINKRNIDIKAFNENYPTIVTNIISEWHEITKSKVEYYTRIAIAGTLLKNQYTIYGGNQD